MVNLKDNEFPIFLFGMSAGLFVSIPIMEIGPRENKANIGDKIVSNDSPEIKFENRNIEKDSVPDLVLKYKNNTEQVFYAHPTWNYGVEYLVDKP